MARKSPTFKVHALWMPLYGGNQRLFIVARGTALYLWRHIFICDKRPAKPVQSATDTDGSTLRLNWDDSCCKAEPAQRKHRSGLRAKVHLAQLAAVWQPLREK
jgi:hypothetical protein